MPRINLLPWRDELRKQRQKDFLLASGVAVVFGVLVMFFTSQVFSSLIEHQGQRNGILKQEIAALDLQIAEIQDLEAKKDRLLARMNIIEQLQRSRPEAVKLFDQIVRTLPEGVYLTSIKQSGINLESKGRAESSTRVSSLMRNIDASDSMQNPTLQVVEAKEVDNRRVSEFTILAQQTVLVHEDEGGVQ
jgi:type IV pilus assembly protein PilN